MRNLFSAASRLVAAVICFLSAPAHSLPLNQHERAAFECKDATKCPYATDFLSQSRTFMTALNAGFRDAGLRIEFAVRSAVSSPVVPIRVNGLPAVAGVICRPHDCPVAYNFIAYPDGRLVGIYVDDARNEHYIGKPSRLEIGVASFRGEWQLGADYTLKEPVQALRSGERLPTPKMISVDQFHRMVAVGSPDGRVFAFSAFITGNTIGFPVLCEYSMGYGACSDRQQQTRVDLDLPQQKAAALYDARGVNGTTICALVELGSGGDRPRLTDFRKGACPTVW